MARAQTQYQASLQNEAASNNYKCQKCKDVGGLIIDKVDEEPGITQGKTYQVWVDCDCTKQQIAQKLLKASEITPEFRAMTFGNFRLDDVPPIVHDMQHLAVEYYKNFDQLEKTEHNSIAFLGQPGVGKTHLLTALSNNMMSNKLKSVLYFPYVEGFNDLRDDFEKLEAKIIRMKQVDILFVDDLFKPVSKPGKDGTRIRVPQASEWELKQLYAVINYRQMNHKPIFISSELSFDEIINLDEALGTRIYKMCKKHFIQVDKDLGLNYRLK